MLHPSNTLHVFQLIGGLNPWIKRWSIPSTGYGPKYGTNATNEATQLVGVQY